MPRSGLPAATATERFFEHDGLLRQVAGRMRRWSIARRARSGTALSMAHLSRIIAGSSAFRVGGSSQPARTSEPRGLNPRVRARPAIFKFRIHVRRWFALAFQRGLETEERPAVSRVVVEFFTV